MIIEENNKVIPEYNACLGRNPVKTRHREGDDRAPTPKGVYSLDFKNENSKFYKPVNISYPNRSDIKNTFPKGYKSKSSASIRDAPNGWGYVTAVTANNNKDMDDFWSLIKIPIRTTISP